jgi:hypothetical protein
MAPRLAAALFAPEVLARTASAPPSIYDEAIEAWHQSEDNPLTLATWLGMSEAEYHLYTLDAEQQPGVYPPDELNSRLAIARAAVTNTIARALLWRHPARRHLMAILADPKPSDAQRQTTLRAVIGDKDHITMLMALRPAATPSR